MLQSMMEGKQTGEPLDHTAFKESTFCIVARGQATSVRFAGFVKKDRDWIWTGEGSWDLSCMTRHWKREAMKRDRSRN